MKTMQMAVIQKNERLAEEIFDMILYAPELAKEANAGQFVNVYTGDSQYLLPRPISICEIDAKRGLLRLIYQVAGKGTAIFSTLRKNETVQIMGPLGNGFSIQEGKSSIIIGGGIGAPPLLELTKRLTGKKTVFLGAKHTPILIEAFQNAGAEVYAATDDGNVGFHGNVVDCIRSKGIETGAVYACGPKVMLKAVARWAKEKGLIAQVSMEERMACGIGACVGCVVKVQKVGETDWQNRKVCKDGPVFLASEVIWDA